MYNYSYYKLELTVDLFPSYLLTGKTLLAKTLARIVNVPFVIADATSLTQASSLPTCKHYFFTMAWKSPTEMH